MPFRTNVNRFEQLKTNVFLVTLINFGFSVLDHLELSAGETWLEKVEFGVK